MKTKLMIASAVLLGSSVVMAAPAEAHDLRDPLWPLIGITGLILHDSAHHHNHHKHGYYDDNRHRYRHRREYSRGRHGHHHRYDRDRPRRHR